jgi:hypothetical protein
VKGSITTPKSGRGRHVAMAPALASLLLDVLAVRRREVLAYGWPETPEWVFPSQSGSPIDQDAHVTPEFEPDLSFLDFGGPGRPYTALAQDTEAGNKNAPVANDRDVSGIWRAQQDSNLRPSGPQRGRLTPVHFKTRVTVDHELKRRHRAWRRVSRPRGHNCRTRTVITSRSQFGELHASARRFAVDDVEVVGTANSKVNR